MLTPIAIEWWDSVTDTDGPWTDRDEAEQWAREPRKDGDAFMTVALMVARTKDSITVVHSESESQLSPPTKIPLQAVKRIGRVAIIWETDGDLGDAEYSSDQ